MKKVLIIAATLLLLTGCATAKLKDGKQSVVTFDEGGISAEELFDVLKEKYGTTEIINLIDQTLLAKLYKEDAAESNYIKDIVASLKAQWGDSFLANVKSYYGATTEKEFKEYVRLVYRKSLWEKDYAKEQVNDTEINDYYEQSIVGDITASHILIQVNKEEEEADALKEIKDLIERLNNGEDFTTLAKEYSDDTATAANGGKLPAFNDRSSYDANFLEAAINLETGKYTSEPVKSQYGYHIIYKESQAEKPALDKVKDEIIETLANKKTEDTSFLTKSLIALREKYKMNITDSQLKSGYKEIYGE